MSSISIQQAVKRYPNGFIALKGIDTEIQTGSFTVILGPSGAGKSTLLRLMNGLETPSSGTVAVGDKIINKNNVRQIRHHVAMVFQQFNLVDRLSVVTNVLTGRLAHRSWMSSMFYLFKPSDMDIAKNALTRVGLVDKAWNRADKLSGGQQQRVGIARALAQQPHIILADEPVASLDPISSEEIMHLLRKICTHDQITVVVNLHQVDLARRFADRVIGMNSGQIVFDGSPEKLDNIALQKIYHKEGAEYESFHAALANA